MVILWLAAVGAVTYFETHLGTAGVPPHLAQDDTEGVETRFGPIGCSLFARSTTVTSTGAVNCFHDSLTPFGGAITLMNMALGEIVPGGIGAGMYGILVLAIVTVFVAGLMIGTHIGQSAIFNPGPHGLTEVMYAFTSMANNNGSAFAGLGTAATWYQTLGGVVML